MGEGNPHHFGCVLISGLCLRFEVDEFNIAEFSVFPYYWGRTNHGDAGETFRSLHNLFLGMGIYFQTIYRSRPGQQKTVASMGGEIVAPLHRYFEQESNCQKS